MRQLTWPLGEQHEKRKRSHDTTDRGSELGVVRHADAWSDVQLKNAHIGQRTAEAIKHQLKSVLSSIVKAALSFSSAWTAGTTTEDARPSHSKIRRFGRGQEVCVCSEHLPNVSHRVR